MDWQPKEAAPKDGTQILVYTVHGDYELTEWFETPHIEWQHIRDDMYKRIERTTYSGWNSNAFDWWMLPPAPPQHTDKP